MCNTLIRLPAFSGANQGLIIPESLVSLNTLATARLMFYSGEKELTCIESKKAAYNYRSCN